MTRYSYEIGTSYPPTNVESLTTPVNPPRSRFYEASQMVDRLDGQVAGQGYAAAVWRFDVLTQAMIDQLRTICTGYSASVYIKTRKLDGTFAYYTAIMVWPSRQMDSRNFNGRYLGLEFEFRQLEAYTP